jgi:hypothetical protein
MILPLAHTVENEEVSFLAISVGSLCLYGSFGHVASLEGC